jgi:hypothetical protein
MNKKKIDIVANAIEQEKIMLDRLPYQLQRESVCRFETSVYPLSGLAKFLTRQVLHLTILKHCIEN